MPTALDTPMTYPSYTNLGLEEGVFDRLMLAAKAHINDEYTAGRINTASYGDVFLGTLESAMQNSTQFLLGVMLIDEKRRGADLANQKAEFELEVLLPLEENLKLKQIEKIDKDMEKIDAEISLMAVEEDLKEAQIVLTNKQVEKLTKDMAKIDAEISLMGKQETKIDKEIEYMTAKILTEQANTQAGIADSGSLIGKQISLLTAQRLGFAGDIETKLTKLYADYDSVFQSVQEIETATTLSAATTGQMAAAESIAASITALS